MDLDRYPSTRDALKESECSGSPACRRAVRYVITMEKHRAKKVCPLHFLDVVVSHAQCKAMGRAWKGQFEGRGTRLLYLDDESYAADAPRPLPE